MRVLVLGAAGFVGRHVVRELASRGHAVEAWSRRAQDVPRGVVARAVDLLEPRSFAVHRGPWDAIVHLAAHAVPADLEHASDGARKAEENLRLVRNAIEHTIRVAPGARFVLASSAAVYARGPGLRREDERPAPRGAYGASKLACEELARSTGELDVRVVRLFNQLGRGMPAGLFVTDLASRVRELGLASRVRALGLASRVHAHPSRQRTTLSMPGVDGLRDFLAVEDGARAIAAVVEGPTAGVERAGTWNVASGTPRRVSELARALFAAAELDVELAFAPSRPGDAPDELVGDPSKLRGELGFVPEVPFEACVARVAEDLFRRS